MPITLSAKGPNPIWPRSVLKRSTRSTAASASDDMEIVARANRLLCLIRSNWTVPGEPPVVAQLLADYEAQDDSGREARLARLIDLPERQGLAAVCRLMRYERSLVLAKTAAVRLLESSDREAASAELAEKLQKGLGAAAALRRAGSSPGCRPGTIHKPLPASGRSLLPRRSGCCCGSLATRRCPSSRACCDSRWRPCGRSVAGRTPPTASID